MIDREKTIRDLETIGAWHTHHYEPFHYECAETIHNALELLREQEPIVIHKDIVDEIYDYIACCPECDMTWAMWFPEKMRFCPGCGKAVKWDAAD